MNRLGKEKRGRKKERERREREKRGKFPFVQNFRSFFSPTIMGIEWGWFTSLSLESHYGSKVKP